MWLEVLVLLSWIHTDGLTLLCPCIPKNVIMIQKARYAYLTVLCSVFTVWWQTEQKTSDFILSFAVEP